MEGLRPATTSTAPRLYLRRMTRAYFFPWIQLLCTTIFAVFAWHIQIPIRPILLWWLFTLVLVLAEDLTTIWSRLTRIFHWLCRTHRSDLQDAPNQVYFLYPAPLLVQTRILLGWQLHLLMLLATWAFAFYVSWIATAAPTVQGILDVLLLLFGIIPYSMLIDAPDSYIKRPIKYFIWIALGLIGLLFSPFSFYRLTGDWLITGLSSTTVFILYTFIFVSRRLWAGERILNEVIRDVSLECLGWPQAGEKLDRVPELIGDRLKHDCVFILQTGSDGEVLTITGAYGDKRHLLGKTVPIVNSLTGKAFREKEPVIWNDVSACPYYHGFTPDDTGAEIAVPILYQGTVYGILDVQTRRKNMYGPEDVGALETIARMLGTAIAIDKRSRFLEGSVRLWEEIGTATNTEFATEEEAFDLIARFARNVLGADLVIYFPLSLAGYPVQPPYWRGELYREDLLRPPLNDTSSSLVKLVARWKPYYESEVSANSLVGQSSMSNVPSFVERERICSTCFIPIGMRHERLAGLFLNFRQPQHFDSLFQFTILSLAQSLAKIAAQIRYRHILYESFGRPELNLHNIINRHLPKGGILRRAESLWVQCSPNCCSSLNQCVFYDLLSHMENFLREVDMIESSIPPNFWQKDLEEELRKHIRTLPPQENGQRPRLHLDSDPQIEKESPWVKLALYRVITEAINNAVSHGEATTIQIHVLRNAMQIEVEVCNDGLPLPNDAQKDQSSNGIYALLAEFREKLGGKAAISPGHGRVGTVVHIMFPSLPFKELKEINR